MRINNKDTSIVEIEFYDCVDGDLYKLIPIRNADIKEYEFPSDGVSKPRERRGIQTLSADFSSVFVIWEEIKKLAGIVFTNWIYIRTPEKDIYRIEICKHPKNSEVQKYEYHEWAKSSIPSCCIEVLPEQHAKRINLAPAKW